MTTKTEMAPVSGAEESIQLLLGGFKDVLKLLKPLQVAGESEEKKLKRTEKRKAAAKAEFSLPVELGEKIDSLSDILGSFNPAEHEVMDQAACNKFVSEVSDIKDVQDVLTGRYSFLRQAVIDLVTEMNRDSADPEFTPGQIDSTELGLSFKKEINGGKVSIDWEKFSTKHSSEYDKVATTTTTTTVVMFGSEILESSTSVSRAVDEKRVVDLMKTEEITLKMLNECLVVAPKTIVVALRKTKAEVE